MPQDHPADELLVIYAEAPGSLAEREDLAAHLEECQACSTRVEEFRLVTSEMRSPEVWAAVADILDERDTQAELSLFAQRLKREDIEASRLLADVLSTPFRFHVSKLMEKPRLLTGGVVRLLSQRAHDEADNEPLFALNLAEAATLLAEQLPDDYYPAEGVYELRGTAWKEYATACRFLGRYTETLDALKRAERAYRHLLAPTVSLGTVELARAIVLWRMERHDQALLSAVTAAEMFARCGHAERFLSAKEVEAVILHRKGDFTAARAA